MSASESPGSPGTASTSDLPPLPPSPTTPEDSDAVESPQGYPTDNSLDEDGSARDEIPAHVLRQIELLNLEVESDPKSIWFDKLIYAPASILDHAATTRTIGSRRKREPSSSMTLLDLPPPADLEVMFGWPPPNGDGDETPEKESVWSEWQDGAVPAPIAHGPAHRELVLRGPPPSARPDVWGTLAAVAELGIGTLYKQLKEDHSPFDKLISRDVPRTFPKLGMFREDSGPGQELLGSILRAYSLYDGEVGYCQGMSFVVAGMLIVGLTELDSFSMLVRLMEGFPPFFRGTPEVVRRPSGALRRSHYAYPLRHLYTPGMPLLHALLHLLTHFASETMPEVQKHLEDAGLEPATWASQWFLTLFTYSFPRFVWERTWDMCFAEVSDEGDHGDQPADGAAPEASRASPASNAKPRKTYFLPRTLLIAALAALQHVKPRLLEANDPEVLLQLLRGDRICNTFADCEAVVDQASSWYNESSFVPVDQVRKKMREFWRSIVDRVASRGTSPAEGDAAREEKQPEVVAAPETDNRSNVAPAVRQQSSFTFGLFRGRGARNDEQDLKQALMEARRRAEEAESRAELLSHQLDVMAARQHDAPLAGQELDEPMMDGSDGWRAEKEMWREEVLRLGRVVDAREAEMVRITDAMASLNARVEELEVMNAELRLENTMLKDMLRAATPSPDPGKGGSRNVARAPSKTLPPPPLTVVDASYPNAAPSSAGDEEGDSKPASWTSRIFASVKESVFGDDEDDDLPDTPVDEERGRRTPTGSRDAARASGRKSPDGRSVLPAPPDSGSLFVITPEMRAAGGTVFRSPSLRRNKQ